MTVEERFWSKVNKHGPVPACRPELGPCWLWKAGMTGKGYGGFFLDGRKQRAHRVAFVLEHGHWPTNQLDHLCRVRLCVNVAHLEDVTGAENIRRGNTGKVQGERGVKTRCPQGHAYTERNVYVIPSTGARLCRECRRERDRVRNAAKCRRRRERRAQRSSA